MAHAKLLLAAEETGDTLYRAQCRLTHLENKLKRLLTDEEDGATGELETIMERADALMISTHASGSNSADTSVSVSKTRLALLIRQCRDGAFIVDKSGSIQETNGNLEALLGYRRTDFKNISLKSIFPLADRLESVTKYFDAFTNHMYLFYERKKFNLSPIETTVLDRQKRPVPFQVKAIYLKNSRAQLTGALFLLRDISRRRKLEKQIQAEKKKLEQILDVSKKIEIIERLKQDLAENTIYIESIIESSTDGIVVTDTSGFIKRVNRAFARLLGYDTSELVDRHWAELNPLEGKDYYTLYGEAVRGRSYIKELLERMGDLFSKGEAYFEAYLKRNDETVVPVGCGLYWVHNKKGERSEGIVIVRDLTERKVAEKKIERAYFELREAKEYLENIISTTVDGIITTDPQGVIERSNESIEVMTGYREDELKGMHISHLSLHRADRGYRQTMSRMVTELFRDGRVTGIESVWKGKNGLHVPIEANAALLKDKKGTVAGGVVGVRDVRERKKLEKMKNDFISNISHELRTPLTSIKGSIDNLLDGIAGQLNEGQQEYLTIINAESNRLVRLIDDLLDLNKLEARSLKLLPVEVEYISLVAQAVYSLKELAYEKGLSIVMEWAASELPLAADRDRIYQVLLNLINNAIKFTERGAITVIVEDVNNGSVTTRIRDTGVGIPRDEVEKIFDRFYQIQRPLAEKSRGAGLGLAISKSLIEMHGGTITVESREGAGSEFTFTLPLQGAE